MSRNSESAAAQLYGTVTRQQKTVPKGTAFFSESTGPEDYALSFFAFSAMSWMHFFGHFSAQAPQPMHLL